MPKPAEYAFVEILEEFLASEYRGVKLYGVKEALEAIIKERLMPIEVRQRHGVIYLVKTNGNGS